MVFHVCICISKEIRPKIKPKKPQIYTHTNISNKQKSLVKSLKIFLIKNIVNKYLLNAYNGSDTGPEIRIHRLS